MAVRIAGAWRVGEEGEASGRRMLDSWAWSEDGGDVRVGSIRVVGAEGERVGRMCVRMRASWGVRWWVGAEDEEGLVVLDAIVSGVG